VGVGVAVLDHLFLLPHFPVPDSKLDALATDRQAGGVAATALVTCARLGLRARYVGKVGTDDDGATLRRALARSGLDVGSLVADATESTRITFGLVDAGSGSRTLIRAADAPACLQPEDLVPDVITAGRVLHLDGYEGAAAVQAARWARAAGMLVSLDAEEATERREELIPLTDVLVVSRAFGGELTGAATVPGILDGLARLGPPLVGVTLGGEGAVVRRGGVTVAAPGFRVDVADTTGAGDVFHGAFLAGLVWSWSLADTLRLANAAAALACRRLGGQAGIPTLAEVRAFLASRGQALPRVPAAGGGGP
jgi:sugar/nucleoside kinase (ribokinase family)